MATKAQIAAMNLYGSLMSEARLRLETAQRATKGSTGLIAPLVEDFCYLQIRKITEIIAICCLVAHGDIKATTKLHGTWKAEEIVKRLSELNPYFFPTPQRHKAEYGVGYAGVIEGPEARTGADRTNYLTKDGLIKIYVNCGGKLHRGSLKALLKEGPVSLKISFPQIEADLALIWELLRNHAIFLSDHKTMFLCRLEQGANGEIYIFEKEADEPA